MARGIALFFIVWVLVYIGIEVFRGMSGKERWQITKTAMYAGATAVIAVALIAVMVAVF